MLNLIVFLLVLSILVLVHELGHFLVAKKIGVKVEEFGLGYPPRVFGKKIGETIYSLNALPFGGFVRLFGEDSSQDVKTSPRPSPNRRGNTKGEVNRAYYSRSKLERSLILVAGVFMNFLLGVVIISYLFTQGVYVPANGVLVESVLPNTPAQYAGIKNKDVIESINGQKVNSPTELVNITKSKLGQFIVLEIKRCDGGVTRCQLLSVSLVPRKNYPANEGAMGIAITANTQFTIYPLWQAPVLGTIEAFKLTWFILQGVVGVFWQLFTSARVPADVAGPIGIYKATGQAVQMGGLIGVLQLIGLLSLNLAVVNILPIPALDGGRFFLIFVEMALGKKKTSKIEGVAQSIGVVLILSLIVLITISDLSKLAFVKSLLQKIKLPF